ncbi:histone acetyltransferase KAT6B-like [Heptranchias perlo]|uniref:histone acetyltransferase KAT6B-like n=1 Tax=Heptranchias perlo TaxID=212740 RepID=UPI00355A81CB
MKNKHLGEATVGNRSNVTSSSVPRTIDQQRVNSLSSDSGEEEEEEEGEEEEEEEEEEEQQQSEDKLDDFQKRMLREHQEAVAKAEAQVDKINVIKERDRRKRIKISCDQLRDLLPKFEGRRNDMASVLEMTVKYLELVRALVPSQEQSRTLSVPEGLYEKWQKPTTKTEPAKPCSAQERATRPMGRRKMKKGPMKTCCTSQTAKGKKQALAGNAGISQHIPQLNTPFISALTQTEPSARPEMNSLKVILNQDTAPGDGGQICIQEKPTASREHVPSPVSCLPAKWFTTLPNGWGDQHLQNLLITGPKTLAPIQQNGSPGGNANQPDNLTFNSPDQWNDVQDHEDSTSSTADKSLEIPASTMDSDTSMNKSQTSASEVKPELEKSSFHVLDLSTLIAAENSLGNWPEVESPETTDELCAEEDVTMVDLIFLSL